MDCLSTFDFDLSGRSYINDKIMETISNTIRALNNNDILYTSTKIPPNNGPIILPPVAVLLTIPWKNPSFPLGANLSAMVGTVGHTNISPMVSIIIAVKNPLKSEAKLAIPNEHIKITIPVIIGPFRFVPNSFIIGFNTGCPRTINAPFIVHNILY